ncbi:hypothetical protein CPB84DRAFT_1787048 [Gymnopilus junonius]|uniref:F-box domain-containing protein n=1 Tax=Gymnopilus junonius TaxID=109634 RepID=A0A9P5NIE1_GYMJU|nr:hypothetical protein CPB84DRAFT_1787048 [Gymnopilus junonius]
MNAFLTPALALPILRACIESAVIFPPTSLDPRAVLSLVCQAWADIINSSPEFWDSYVIYPVLLTNVVQQMNTFNLFVSRTQGYGVFGLGQLSIMQSIIRPHANQIRFLKCLLVGNDIADFFQFINTGAFQNLEGCHIRFFNGNAPAPIVMERSNIVPFPRLTVAKFDLYLKLSFNQLTMLALAEIPMTPSAFVHIARSSQSLVTASFSIKFDIGSKALRLTLPSLNTLRLRLINPNYYPTFIQVLRLPNLNSLWIERTENIWPFDWNVRQYAVFLRLAGVGPSLKNFPSPGLDIGTGVLVPKLATLALACRKDVRAVLHMVKMRNGAHAHSESFTKITLVVPATGYADLDEELESECRFMLPCTVCSSHCGWGK